MHDFDSERVQVWRDRQAQDRSFKLGGEEFSYKVAVTPEALLPWLTLNAEQTEEEAIAAIDQTVLNFLEPGQEEKWQRVRSPELVPPVTQTNLLDLCRWLMEQQAGRPTGTSSASTPGSPTPPSGTTSTDDSGSRLAVVGA